MLNKWDFSEQECFKIKMFSKQDSKDVIILCNSPLDKLTVKNLPYLGVQF